MGRTAAVKSSLTLHWALGQLSRQLGGAGSCEGFEAVGKAKPRLLQEPARSDGSLPGCMVSGGGRGGAGEAKERGPTAAARFHTAGRRVSRPSLGAWGPAAAGRRPPEPSGAAGRGAARHAASAAAPFAVPGGGRQRSSLLWGPQTLLRCCTAAASLVSSCWRSPSPRPPAPHTLPTQTPTGADSGAHSSAEPSSLQQQSHSQAPHRTLSVHWAEALEQHSQRPHTPLHTLCTPDKPCLKAQQTSFPFLEEVCGADAGAALLQCTACRCGVQARPAMAALLASSMHAAGADL